MPFWNSTRHVIHKDLPYFLESCLLKGDAMNLRLMFEVLGPLSLSFWIKYAKKQRFQLFIYCKARFYSSIYIKVTGKNVKNWYFDFSRFCKKNLSKCCELISISIAFKMAPIKQSNLKIKESIIEFYKLHSKKGHGYTYNQWKHKKSKSRKKLTMIL